MKTKIVILFVNFPKQFSITVKGKEKMPHILEKYKDNYEFEIIDLEGDKDFFSKELVSKADIVIYDVRLFISNHKKIISFVKEWASPYIFCNNFF